MPKIMTIDDSEFSRTIIKNALRRHGYEDFVETDNPALALPMYKKERPDVVLLDIVITPNMGGIEVLKQIRKADPHARVIMVSVMNQKEIDDAAKNAGALGFVRKPIVEADLAQAVEKALKS